MLNPLRNQRTSTVLQDVSRASSRIAQESRGLAEVARSELTPLGRELRDQAADTVAQARQAAAARLAGAAEVVDTGHQRRRRLPLLLAALAGVVVALAVKLAKSRRRHHVEDAGDAAEQAEQPTTRRGTRDHSETTDEPSETERAPAETPTAARARQAAEVSSGNKSS